MATQALSLTPAKPQSSRMRSPTFRRPAFFVLGAGALGAIVLGIGASIGLLAGVAALLAVCLGLATVERPYLGAYVLVAVAPVTSGLKRGLPIPGLRLSEFVIASLATIVLVSAKRSTRARWTAFDWLALAYVIGTAGLGGADMAARGEPIHSEALGTLIGPLQFFLLYRAVRVALPEPRQRSRAVAMILLGSLFVTILTLAQQFNVLGAKHLISNITSISESSLTFSYQQLSNRVTGPFPHWQVLSAYLFSVLLIGAVVLLSKRRDILPRWALIPIMALLAASLAATVTITTIIGTLVGCIVLGIWYRRGLQMMSALGVLAAIAVILFSSLFTARYEDQTRTQAASHSTILPDARVPHRGLGHHYIPEVAKSYLRDTDHNYPPQSASNIPSRCASSCYCEAGFRYYSSTLDWSPYCWRTPNGACS